MHGILTVTIVWEVDSIAAVISIVDWSIWQV